MMQSCDKNKTGLDEEALVLHCAPDELEGDGIGRATSAVGRRAKKSIATRALQRMLAYGPRRFQPLDPAVDWDDHCEDDYSETNPSTSAAIGKALERGTERLSSIFIKSSREEHHTPILADTADGARGFDADIKADKALVRHVALAAAMTTWCILQPFILFFVIAHFKQYVHALTVHIEVSCLPFADAYSHHFRALTSHFTIPFFALSVLGGAVLGPKVALEELRVKHIGVSPSRRRVSVYGLALGLMTLMELMPILLYFDAD